MDASDQFGSAMGGTPGDGIQHNLQQQQMMQPNNNPSTPAGGYPPATPANTPAAANPHQATPYPNARSGSLTQYATPAMQGNSPYNFSPPPQPSTQNTADMSYAQRAAMLQQQQPRTVYNPTNNPSTPGGLYPQSQQAALYAQPSPQQQQNTAGMSFAQRSQMMQQQPPSMTSYPSQQQQQQQPGGMMYGANQTALQQSAPGASPSVGGGMQPQQEQPPQQQNQYGAGMQQQPPQQQNQYGAGMQQQPPQHPPNQQIQQQQTTAAAGSYAQRSVMAQQNQYGAGMQQQPPQQQNQYGAGIQQQQPQPQQNLYGAGMQQPQPQQQAQNQQIQQQHPPAAGGSYAQRSTMAHSGMGQPAANNMTLSSGMAPTFPQPVAATAVNPQQFQQPQMMQYQQHPPPTPRNPFDDPPEVKAQQQRLLTDGTRKVQEHAYYMRQAMERNDLPAVLDRAASMVGELGEHAHAHHHHRLHPPAPGATGTTTALSPKNYYELHLRALEEMPTLEDYLLNIAQGNTASAPNAMGGPTNPTMMPPQPMMQMKGQQQTNISYTMKELYDIVQYCPNVLSRLYLQICAASALIRSGQVGARWVMKDLIEAVKCVQNPVRGLFLRHYLLQAFRDKLPDESIPLDQVGPPMTPFAQPEAAAPAANATSAEGEEDSKPAATTPSPAIAADVMSTERGTVKDSYQFILANFIEMNKLWVRIQHLPGDGRSKDVRRRRERERTELRVLVGTNMVRLSALESITSSIYGQVILPTVLDHIVISADPLAQAYLIDCITQVFPDEYHIETMPILLGVCPKLRDKVNIRTILQALMDRLANYLADEELLDEKDLNQVKKSLAQDSFKMFDECVQNVYNARGPKLQAKEVIRLQIALLAFTKKCFPQNREQVIVCLNHCVVALQQASANQALMQDFQHGNNMAPQQPPPRVPLDEVATKELEKLLSIPLDEMGLGVLTLDHYSDLIGFLPWANRRQVALTMLEAISNKGSPPESIKELEQLFAVIAPVLRNEFDAPPTAQPAAESTERTVNLMAGLGIAPSQPMQEPGFQPQQGGGVESPEDAAMISKLIHLLNHSDTDVVYEMLNVVRNHLSYRTSSAYSALVFASFKLATRIVDEELGEIVSPAETNEGPKSVENGESTTEELNEEAGKEAKEDENEEAGKEVKEDEKEKGSAAAVEETPLMAEKKVSTPKSISARKVLIFTQQAIAALSKRKPETGVNFYLEAALVADRFGKRGEGQEATYGPIAYEFMSQAFALYEENSGDSKLQTRCVVAIIGTLLACRSVGKEDYEGLIMKTAQYAAKMLKKPDQCEMVALCSYLFYVIGEDDTVIYSNPQRGLECLQRALKLADACTSANPANLRLFVELLDHYLYFFEKKNPSIGGNYITGLVALIKEHTDNLGQHGDPAVREAREHFLQIVRHIKNMKEKTEMADHFAIIDVSSVVT